MGRALDGVAVLVTRPRGRADALLAGLRAAGALAYHQPLLRIRALDPERDVDLLAAGRQRILDLDRYARVICVSVNAVRHGLDWLGHYWPQWPLGLRWYGIGAATAAALEREGCRAAHPGGGMTSEELLALPELARVRGERILILRGVGGRTELARVLTARGAQVDYLECYWREPEPLSGATLRQRLRQWSVDAVCLNSGETLARYHALLEECGDDGGRDDGGRDEESHRDEKSRDGDMEDRARAWQALLVVPAPRVARAAHALGFERVVVADNAGDDATLAALCRHFGGLIA